MSSNKIEVVDISQPLDAKCIQRGELTYVRVEICNKFFSACVDSGSMISMMSDAVYATIGKPGRVLDISLGVEMALTQKGRLTKCAEIDQMWLGETLVKGAQFVLAPQITHGIILGNDLIRRLGIAVEPHPTDPSRDKVSIGRRKKRKVVPIVSNLPGGCAVPFVRQCFVQEAVAILPRAVVPVAVRFSEAIDTVEGYFMAN